MAIVGNRRPPKDRGLPFFKPLNLKGIWQQQHSQDMRPSSLEIGLLAPALAHRIFDALSIQALQCQQLGRIAVFDEFIGKTQLQ